MDSIDVYMYGHAKGTVKTIGFFGRRYRDGKSLMEKTSANERVIMK